MLASALQGRIAGLTSGSSSGLRQLLGASPGEFKRKPVERNQRDIRATLLMQPPLQPIPQPRVG
jgi:hypothetical protein